MEKSKDLDFRTLNANEIECRVGNTIKDKQTGNVKAFYILLYKNARVDQCILDETVGQFNWKCHYYQVKNTMVCSVSIWNDERKEWVSKDNGGDDDFNTEQVKAELSDSFKRACFNWGIGRELYYSPKIYVECKDGNDQYSRYSVKVIEYDQKKRITNLVVVNDKTKQVVFLYGKDTKVAQTSQNEPKNENEQVVEPKGSIDKNDLKTIQAYVMAFQSETSRTNFYAWLDKNFGTMNIEMLTLSQGKQVLKRLGGK